VLVLAAVSAPGDKAFITFTTTTTTTTATTTTAQTAASQLSLNPTRLTSLFPRNNQPGLPSLGRRFPPLSSHPNFPTTFPFIGDWTFLGQPTFVTSACDLTTSHFPPGAFSPIPFFLL